MSGETLSDHNELFVLEHSNKLLSQAVDAGTVVNKENNFRGSRRSYLIQLIAEQLLVHMS